MSQGHAHPNALDRAVDPGHETVTPDEVRRLLAACSSRAPTGLRNRALIIVLYRGGLRVSEALSLRLADVDARDRSLVVGTDSRSRRFGLDLGSFRVIERWIDRRQELGVSDAASLLCTLDGKPLASSYLRALLHRLAQKAGIEKRVSAEVLRRSLALELVEEGFSIAAIQARLGHSAAAVTSRYLARIEHDDEIGDLSRRREWLL